MKKLICVLVLMVGGIAAMSAQKAELTKGTMFEVSQETGLDYVLRLDPDRLLSPCYTAMGKAPKAPTYGGWESQQIQGHSLGHYLSALSGFVYYTGNAEAKEKLDYTVNCIKQIQRKDGYFAGIPSTPFDQAFTGNFTAERFSLAGWWVPWYSVHKIYAGLIDAYTLGGNKDALEIVKKMADWAINGTKNMTEEQFQKMLYCEQGGMCKSLADIYAITGEKKYLDLAERFIDKEVVVPAEKQVDKLQGFHANTQIPKFIGLARLYDLTGKEEYRVAAQFFFDTVTQRRSYAIGGNSDGEHFGAEYEEKLTRATAETCNTYNMLELAEYIFKWNKNSDSSDFYETALYNHILASQDPDTGAKTYFVGLMPGYFKVYGSFENAFWCCTGTGMENPERYNRFIAKDYDNTVYVNLYIPSTFTTDDGWKFQIITNFPYEQKATIKVLSKGTNSKALKVRVPSWIQERERNSDGYKVLSSSVKEGDSFTVDLPMKLNIRKTRDKSGNFSVLYGPIVLAADVGTKGMPVDIVNDQTIYMNSPVKKISPITADLSHPENWITETDPSTLTFTTAESAATESIAYTLKPFYTIHHTRYAVYFNSSELQEDPRTVKLTGITDDKVETGRQQSEVDHRYSSEGSYAGYLTQADSSFRCVDKENGWFGYKIKLDTRKEQKLLVSVYGKDKGSVDVYINDTLIKTITLDGDGEDGLVDIEIPLDASLVAQWCNGKKQTKADLKFTGSSVPSIKILEVRIIH